MPALVLAQTIRLSGIKAETGGRGIDGRIAAPVDEGARSTPPSTEIGQAPPPSRPR